jgi:amino acid transporter
MTEHSRPHRLKREMSGFGGMVITLTNLSPSIAVFIAAPVVIQQAGSFAIVACALAVILGLVVAGIYAELGSAFPNAGGDYTLIGNTLGPVARFANLSGALAGIPVALALSGLGVADSLKVMWPGVAAIPTGLACIVVATGLGALSVRMNAWITGLFMVVEIAAIVATGALGFLHPHRDLLDVLLHPVMTTTDGQRATSLLAMAGAGSAAVYVMNGYGAAVYFGEEVIGARRKMIWMIYGALILGGLTVIPPLVGVIIGAPDLGVLAVSAAPFQDFVLQAGGRTMAWLVSVGVAIAIFNAMIAISLIGGRILYSAARENAWHARLNGPLATVHSRYGSPWVATLVVGAASLLLCLLPLPILVTINGSGAAIGYGLLAVGVIAGRRGGKTSRSHSPMPWHPVGPLVVVVTAVGLLVAGIAQGGAGRAGIIVSLAIMAAGAIYYLAVVRGAGTWARHDPEEEEVVAA